MWTTRTGAFGHGRANGGPGGVVVSTTARLGVGVLLLAHGLVHLLYLARDVDAFSLDSTWLPEMLRRPVALVLLTATVLSFALVALGTWGVPGLSSAWPVLTVFAAAVSTLLLLLFWDWQLIFGLVIDAALVTLALWQPVWLQHLIWGTA
ncbi:hypothetical protein [Rhodococcus sp. ACS1]|uniref:hypothetical protein n=1 Tax=Rhodococcus sp. ACS1 TaxID=2028570 RepID=UPI00211B9F14|nr:hypothetical protein [Rhodococcus sp. ACS1]